MAGSTPNESTTPAAEGTAIRPFRNEVPQDEIELRRRVQATRWPYRETVTDRSHGVQLARLRPLLTPSKGPQMSEETRTAGSPTVVLAHDACADAVLEVGGAK